MLAICEISLAQFTIKGRVSDAVTDESLARVAVFVSDIKQVVSTDTSGEFRITGLPEGFIQFQFSLLGYKGYEITIETDKISGTS